MSWGRAGAVAGRLRAPLGRVAVPLFVAVATPAAAQVGDPVNPQEGAAPTLEEGAPPAASRAAYPAPLTLPTAGRPLAAYEWDLGGQLATGALTLLDLLEDGLPGFTSVRGAFYGGPHAAFDGLLGPGFVRVVVDGREHAPLEGAEVDLARYSLAALERVVALRQVDGWTIELTTLRHDREDAYSRIAAGTGQPGVELLQGVFTNGLGRRFTLGVAMDLLSVTGGELPSDRFDFWGKFSWMPVDNRAGVELQFRSSSRERTLAARQELDGRELFLHARGELASGIQASAWAGTEELREMDTTVARSRHAGLRLTARRERAFGRLEVHARDAAFQPEVAAEGSAGVRPLPTLHLEAAGRAESWRGFDAGGLRGGVRWAPDLGLDLAFAVAAATGVRGVARRPGTEAPEGEGRPGAGFVPPSLEADSLGFDVAEASVEGRLGPFHLGERVGWQRLSRLLPLGGPLDPGPVRPGAELHFFETTASGPVAPIGWLLDGVAPIRLRGTWRYARLLEGAFPGWFAEQVVRGELFFHDDFFAGNLEVRSALALERRTDLSVPVDVAGGLAVSPAFSRWDFDLFVRIDTFRIWWRVENLSGIIAGDVPGLPFPRNRNVFGVRWEFFN